ncbi:MAG: hypothetical protein GX249_13650 [Firmicutes bacterium]|nr:hypothetical protein [Bacillota bacterium]
MVNKHLQRTILGVVDNQINANDPPITKITLERLRKLGYSERDAKKKIAAILIEEMYDVMKNGEEFDEKRYTDKLSALK